MADTQDQAVADEFYLSSDTSFDVHAVPGAPEPRWMQLPHTGIARPAFVLLAGESATLRTPLRVGADTMMQLRFAAAIADLSADGADLALSLVGEDGRTHPIATFQIPPGPAGLVPRTLRIDLAPWKGRSYRLKLSAGPGLAGDPRGDWVAVIDLEVGAMDRLDALHARAFRTERTENEIAHFSNVYQHASYAADTRSETRGDEPVLALQALVRQAKTQPAFAAAPTTSYVAPQALNPVPKGAYDYAHHLLFRELRAVPPNFHSRLVERCRHEPVRVLSLCSGAARIEAQFALAAGDRARWTLLDISPDLLQDAARNFPEGIRPTLVQADLNDVAPFGEQFDVVMCVSGLHHIVELERVVDFIEAVLADGGEFWSIGEAIGRSGNRLYPGEYRAANAFFQTLPAALRRNRATGVVDSHLPDANYSDATFEGIRSDEIEAVLARRLEPVDLCRRNCFLWRLVDLAYTDNYDLSDDRHVGWIQKAVTAELEHFRSGGRPSELHGVYRKRIY